MSVSIGNLLYETVERDNMIYYIPLSLFKDVDVATPTATLHRRSDYIFEVVKSPNGFTSEQIMIKNDRRTLEQLNYSFGKATIE